MKTLRLKIRTNITIVISCIAALILLSKFNANAQLCSNGSIQTIYNGSQSGFKTERLGAGFMNDPYWYRLYAGCMKIATLRDNGGTNLAVSDDDNNWNDPYNNAVDRLKMVAASAHWAAQKSFQYFDDIHGHRGLRGFVTSSTTDLRVVTNLGSHFYTDLHAQDLSQFGGTINHTIVCGRRNNRDWVSLDMIGRQYAKGIIFWTSKVGFDTHITPVNSEAGALLEAFGDIFGTMVEESVEGNGFDWTIGEDMGQSFIRRNMANPSAMGAPDTYGVGSWSNSNDRYINCNVINYWFYLLAQGGAGTNDKGDQYNVNGIGTTNARRIVFDAFTDEFSRTTSFVQAAAKTIQKAQSLYGANSNEAIQVCNAWYAVGVGSQPCATNNNGGGNTASMSLSNSVTQPNGFSVTFNTSGYQAGSLRLVIYDGGNFLRVNSPQNGASGTINIPSTTGWINGVCRVFLAHTPTNNSILAFETITLNQISQTASIGSLGSVTSPAGFSVTYSSAGYQTGDRFRFKVYDGNNDLKHTSSYIYASSGTWTVPSTAGYALGSCSIKLYDKNNILKDTEQWFLEAPAVTYCESYGTSSDSLWINSVALGNIQNISGDDNGSADFSNISTVLSDGMEITVDPGFATYFAGTEFVSTASTQGIFWNVWIDFNQDGDFDDNGELVLQQEQPTFLRGDANGDGQVNMSDMIHILGVLFKGEGTFVNPDAADVNDNGFIEITDAIYLSNYLFGGTQNTLPEPFLSPGIDPTIDVLANNNIVGAINIPVNAEEGETRMRIQAKAGAFAASACEIFTFGEVEDYTVDIIGGGNKMNPADADGEVIEPGKEPIIKELLEEEEMALTMLMKDPEAIKLSVKAFPNPTTDFLTLQVNGMLENSFSYKIIDLTGQLIVQQLDLYGQNVRLDVSQLPKGMYTVVVQVGTQKESKRILVK